MIALIDQYQKELLPVCVRRTGRKVNGFAASTVETYTISIKAFCSFARNQLEKRVFCLSAKNRRQKIGVKS